MHLPWLRELPPVRASTATSRLWIPRAEVVGQYDARRGTDGEGDDVVLDAVREAMPPFSPEAVIGEFATVARSYGVRHVRATVRR